MYFRILHNETNGELSYLLADSDAREAVLVDPRAQDIPVLQALLAERALRLRWVLRTHQHDACMPQELERLSGLGAPIVQGCDTPGVRVAAQGDKLDFGNEVVAVVATPGHTDSCLSYAWRDRMFCGDLLGVDACCHQPYPLAPESLWNTVRQKVFTLADETLLFVGNASRAQAVTTVLQQRRWNPFFTGLSRDEFLTRAASLRQPTPAIP